MGEKTGIVMACDEGHIFIGGPGQVGRDCPTCGKPLKISQPSR